MIGDRPIQEGVCWSAGAPVLAGQASHVDPVRSNPATVGQPRGRKSVWRLLVGRKAKKGLGSTLYRKYGKLEWGSGIHNKRTPGAPGFPKRGALRRLQRWCSFDLLLRLPSVGYAVCGGLEQCDDRHQTVVMPRGGRTEASTHSEKSHTRAKSTNPICGTRVSCMVCC